MSTKPTQLQVDQGYLRGHYRRLIARCGAKKATVAVGHTILRIVYHVLNEQEAYREPVIIAHDERRRAQTQRRSATQ